MMKEFPPFRLDTANQCLWRRDENTKDERILLTPKAFGVLRYLVEHASRLVTHDELLDAVWPATHVQPQAVKKLILDLRGALGDRAQKPQFIETSHRRGYRFIAAVHEVGEGQSVAPAPSSPIRLVGREKQLGQLRECLGKALRGERQLVFITGEVGIGKTALADEFQHRTVREVAGIRIAYGQCIEGYGGKEAYYPMLEALGQLCRSPGGESVVQVLAAQAPTWLIQFPALVKRDHREMLQRELLGATRDRMLREIGDALEAITSTNALLLVFEDLQWVDSATVDLISALARRRASARLMLLGTKRPLDTVQEHPLRALKDELLVHQLCQEIALEPLGEAEVAEYLAAESSDAPLPAGLTQLIHLQSEGNPLFMVASLEHLTERGLIRREHGSWKFAVPLRQIALEVPQKLRRMLEAQIDSLPQEDQRTLEVASIEGTAFSVEVSAPAANLHPEPFEELCQRLSRRRHIVRPMESQRREDGVGCQTYEFVHALYREVLYRRQAPGRRAKLHQHIAERLRYLHSEHVSEIAARLSYHLEQASDWSGAIQYLRLEAETLGLRFAPREATGVLQRALELSYKLPEAKRAEIETGILQTLTTIYVVSFDSRAIETCQSLIELAAHHGFVDLQAQALVDIAIPLSYFSTQRSLEATDQALQLSESQTDPLMRARTRASCSVRRVWAAGWNAGDAEECQKAVEEIQKSGDRLLLASYLIDCNLMQWCSSHYREAKRNALASLTILLGKREHIGDFPLKGFDSYPANPYLSSALWLTQTILPWTLLLLGEWGEAIAEIKSGIELAERNGDHYRSQTLLLYQAWVHLNAMDFGGVVRICDSVLPFLETPGSGPWRRLGLILAGSAETALGNNESAYRHLSTAKAEMDRQTLIFDWYSRMILGSALTELWLVRGEQSRARAEAESFLDITRSTAERTWQALAWEAYARVAMAENHFERAQDGVANASHTMEGFEVPLAEWRVHATGALLYERMGDRELAQQHSSRSCATILQLADSLQPGDALQGIFLSAPPIRKILECARAGDGGRQTKPE
jgi:DNA-binding winged helix-turn-helix (wHTH) protein/tetratricopeptide (TPR) repeat protein